MYVEYEDILSRITDKPIWWHFGLPRFDPFQPTDVRVYGRQVALVHTECQACGARYDVAVVPNREWSDLRDSLAYTNDLPIGDPPNALHAAKGCSGSTMGSIQIEILQFWDMADVMRGWQREPEWERRLAGSNWKKMGEFGDSALSRIRASARGGEWIEAVEQGNFAVMVSILEEFECARPREVAHAVDLQRKDRAFLDKRIALGRERFGSA